MKTPDSIVLWELGEAGLDGFETHSPFCLKVHRALRLAGLPYARRHVANPASLARLSAARQAPILAVDGQPIADSTSILRWIDAVVPGALVPASADERLRAEAWLWEGYADAALYGFVLAARWADPRNWPVVRAAYFEQAPWLVRALVVPRLRAGVVAGLVARDVTRRGLDATWTELGRTLDDLEARAPWNGFWLGTDEPTVADLSLFAQLHELRSPLTPVQARMIAVRPRLDDWLDRVDARTRATRSDAGRGARLRAVTTALAEAKVA